MPDVHALTLFALAALTLLAIPGPAVLFVVVQSVEHGRARGLASVVGVHIGTAVHTCAAAVGLSALVVSSAAAFNSVKLVGAAYLVWLGVRRLLGSDGDVHAPRAGPSWTSSVRRGVIVNVFNPKTALFFLAFMPQFVDPARAVWPQVLVFGALFALLGLVSDSVYVLAAASVAATLRRRRRALRYASGVVYIALGGATALARRTA
jgi:threonine/homoserine/homoserine lactone efflux protein